MSSQARSGADTVVELDRPVDDQVVLRTVDGAEDLLAEDLGHLGPLTRSEAQVGLHLAGPLQQVHDSRLFVSLAVPLAGSPGDEQFLASLRATRRTGVLSALKADGPLRFRIDAGTPGVAAPAGALARELGWVNDPGDWAVNLMPSATGWEAEVGPLYWTRRFGSFERLPWSTKPVVAEVLARLAKLRPGHRLIDPFCGTGTLLVTAGRLEPGLVLAGSDLDPAAVELARTNFARFGTVGRLDVGPAGSIDRPDHSVDRVVSNLPFGKLVGSHGGNEQLYPAVLRELARLLESSGRAVLMTDDKRLFKDAVARTPGLKIVRERMLRYGGVTPTVFVLTRTRKR